MPNKKNVRRKHERTTKRTGRKPEEIQKLIQEIAAARTSGATLTKALKQAGVPYNTYHKWAKKYPAPAPDTSARPVTPRPKGRSADEIRKILDNVAGARKAGMGLIETLKEMGLSMSTYRYWLKKHGEKTGAATAKRSPGPGGKKLSVLSLLEEMADNRRKRQELESVEQQILDLDTRFAQLRNNLDGLSG